MERLQPGDIIRMPSTSLTHYGIAVGGRWMIHLVPESEQNWFLEKGLYEKANIVEYCLDTKKTCERDNSWDARDGWIPYHSWQVVERAFSKLGDSFEGCSVIFKDGKKFALWCRYVSIYQCFRQLIISKVLFK